MKGEMLHVLAKPGKHRGTTYRITYLMQRLLPPISEARSPRQPKLTVDQTQDQPPEIMARIFWHVCQGVVMLPPTDPWSYPWNLSHVCSRWKQIVWNFTKLYNIVIVDHDSSGPRAVDNTRESLSYVLSNSSTPLSLSVFCTDPEDLEISDIILAHTQRFSGLYLYNVSQQLLSSIWALPPGSFENIEHFYVAFYSDSDYVRDNISSVFESSKIRSITYSANPPIYHREMLLIPRSTISEIFINVIPVPACIVHDILLSCSSLISCSFTICREDSVPSGTKVTLPRLERLTLEIPRTFDWISFFTPFRTPCLEHLSLSSRGSGPSFSTLTSLILQLNGPLKYLSTYLREEVGGSMNHADIRPLLEGIPSLMTIHLRPWIISPLVFRDMQSGPLSSPTRAGLCVNPEGLAAFLGFLDSYIQNRPSPQRPLEDIMLSCCNGPGYSQVEERYLASYEKYTSIKGFRLSVKNPLTGRRVTPRSRRQ